MKEQIAETFLIISIFGGFSFALFVIVEVIKNIIDLFGWKKVRLSMKDIDEIRANTKNINFILFRKQITWKKASFDHLNGILKIK